MGSAQRAVRCFMAATRRVALAATEWLFWRDHMRGTLTFMGLPTP